MGVLALTMALALHSEVEAVRRSRSRLQLKKGVDRRTTMDLIGGNAGGNGGLVEWFLSYVATKEDVSWIEEAESAAK